MDGEGPETVRVGGCEKKRLRFGEERHREESPCPECGVYYFALHAWGCEVEECPACGGSLAACGCEDE